jgi:4-nitrophenyl phosphatase
MSGIEQELALSEGISYIGGTSPPDNTLSFTFDLSTFHKDPNGAVLCGLDTAINHTKLCKAFQYLHDDPNEERVKFLTTNMDLTAPVKVIAWLGLVHRDVGQSVRKGTVEFGETWESSDGLY